MSHDPSIKDRFSGFFGDSAAAPPIPLGHRAADACLGGGLRQGALHEVLPAAPSAAASASGFALALAWRLCAARKWLLWVQQDFSAVENGEVHAAGLLELGIDPDRVLLLRAPDPLGALRAGAEGLDCKGLGAVIVESWGAAKAFDLTASRRLLLAAGRHGTGIVALHFGRKPMPSAAETRWLIGTAPSSPNEDWGMPAFDAGLVRNRHGAGGHWVMEWDSNHGIFQAYSRALADASFHRPLEAPLEGVRPAG